MKAKSKPINVRVLKRPNPALYKRASLPVADAIWTFDMPLVRKPKPVVKINKAPYIFVYKTSAPKPRHDKKWAFRMSGVIAIFVMLIYSFGYHMTAAYLSDKITSSGNTFTAGTLIFSTTLGSWSGTSTNMHPGDSATIAGTFKNTGTLPEKYAITAAQTSGSDSGFCGALEVSASINSSVIYTGALLSLNTVSQINSNVTDNLSLTASLPGTAPTFGPVSCNFNFVFNAFQTNLSSGASGFNFSAAIPETLTSGTLSPIQDSYIDQKDSGSNFGSATTTQVHSENGNKSRRALVQFSLNLPNGITVNNANLKMFMQTAPASSRTYEVHRITSPWTEGAVTWDLKPSFISSSTATTSTGNASGVTLSWNVTSDVQDYVNGTANDGWYIIDSNESNNPATTGTFASRENSTISERPILEVNFTGTATTTHMVINEVYYDTGVGSRPANQWVELYNPTSSPIDISSWKLASSNGTTTLPSGITPIGAKQFAVVSPSATTWNLWPIIATDGATKVVSNMGTSTGLSLAGDRVVLANSAGTIVDSMGYGSNTTGFNPPAAVQSSGNGNSLARIIKGYDSDNAGDWVVSTTPNPGTNPGPNEGPDGSEVMRFTSEGVEVAATEDGLPPIDTTAPTDTTAPIAPADITATDTPISTPTDVTGSSTSTSTLPADNLVGDTSTSTETSTTDATATSTAPAISLGGTDVSATSTAESTATSTPDSSTSTPPADPNASTTTIPDATTTLPSAGLGSADANATSTPDTIQPQVTASPTQDPTTNQAVVPEPTAQPQPANSTTPTTGGGNE